jgi:hypothetical protein
LQLTQLTTAPSSTLQLADLPQEIFVSFKNVYDILLNPIQRQAYNDLGNTGIAFVKRRFYCMEKIRMHFIPLLQDFIEWVNLDSSLLDDVHKLIRVHVHVKLE